MIGDRWRRQHLKVAALSAEAGDQWSRAARSRQAVGARIARVTPGQWMAGSFAVGFVFGLTRRRGGGSGGGAISGSLRLANTAVLAWRLLARDPLGGPEA